jgi:hypothetical protein
MTPKGDATVLGNNTEICSIQNSHIWQCGGTIHEESEGHLKKEEGCFNVLERLIRKAASLPAGLQRASTHDATGTAPIIMVFRKCCVRASPDKVQLLTDCMTELMPRYI